MIVNIYTDASVNGQHKVGGYAFVIICDMDKIIKAAKFKGEILSPHDGEMMCIANAIHTLQKSNFVGIDKIIITTDSQLSINALHTNESVSRSKAQRLLIDDIYFTMLEACLKYGFSIRDVKKVFDFKKVKAHTNKQDFASRANNYCDKEAIKHCRKAVEDKLKKIKT